MTQQAELNIEAASEAAFPSRELPIDQGTAAVFQVVRAKPEAGQSFGLSSKVETAHDAKMVLMGISNAIAQAISMEARKYVETIATDMPNAIDFTKDGIGHFEGHLIAYPVQLDMKAMLLEAELPATKLVCWDYLTDGDMWFAIPALQRPTLIVSEPLVEFDEKAGLLAATVHYEIQPGGAIVKNLDTSGPHWERMSPEEAAAASAT